MEKVRNSNNSEVYGHWDIVEKQIGGIVARRDIIFPLVAYENLNWVLCRLTADSLERIYHISSDDWRTHLLCVPNFKLVTATRNYVQGNVHLEKKENIYEKVLLFENNLSALDTKLIMVTDNMEGPFTILEGNKRAIALNSLNKLIDREVYVGISPNITNYHWARYSYL